MDGALHGSGPVDAATLEIEIIGEDGSGADRFVMTGGELVAGRDPDCDVLLEDTGCHVSRRHFRIVRRGAAPEKARWGVPHAMFFLEDISTNGTFLNDGKERIPGYMALSNGDLIQAGPFLLRVQTRAVLEAPEGEEGTSAEAAPEVEDEAKAPEIRPDPDATDDDTPADAAETPNTDDGAAAPAEADDDEPATSTAEESEAAPPKADDAASEAPKARRVVRPVRLRGSARARPRAKGAEPPAETPSDASAARPAPSRDTADGAAPVRPTRPPRPKGPRAARPAPPEAQSASDAAEAQPRRPRPPLPDLADD
ncbi:MAG: FHA domain-containing protein, partial [Pseudomonadota bacterium]